MGNVMSESDTHEGHYSNPSRANKSQKDRGFLPPIHVQLPQGRGTENTTKNNDGNPYADASMGYCDGMPVDCSNGQLDYIQLPIS